MDSEWISFIEHLNSIEIFKFDEKIFNDAIYLSMIFNEMYKIDLYGLQK